MQELFAQVIGHVRSMWRFRWLAAGLAWVACLAGWAWVSTLPDVYEARARVYVDTTSQLRNLLGDQIVGTDVEAQLNQVRQSLLGRVQLEKVARETDLDLETQTPEEFQVLVSRLADDIAINGAGGDRRNPNNLYTITYRHTSPAKAVDVVEELLSTFVGDTLGAQTNSANTARQFLQKQLVEYEQRLQVAEQRLADFRKRNYDRLPGSQGGYFQRLQGETAALKEVEKQLELAKSRRERIRQQLRGESPILETGEDGATGPLANLEGRIRKHEALLDELLLRYTSQHPDVVSAEETLDRLRKEMQNKIDAMRATGDGSQAAPVASNNPVYQQLQIALNDAEIEIAALEADRADRLQRVEELKSLIDEVPDTEAELARLNRDYNVIHGQYQALLASLEREKLTREAQATGQVEFRIIDPPVASVEPVAPERPRLLAMVLIAGLGAGAGLAFLLAQVRPVVQSIASAQGLTGFPVVGAVSIVWGTQLERAGPSYAAFVACLAGLLVAFAGVFYLQVLGA